MPSKTPIPFLLRELDDYQWRLRVETSPEALRMVALNMLRDYREALEFIDELLDEADPYQDALPLGWSIIDGGDFAVVESSA